VEWSFFSSDQVLRGKRVQRASGASPIISQSIYRMTLRWPSGGHCRGGRSSLYPFHTLVATLSPVLNSHTHTVEKAC
jgi:hypothetical protein